jgi:hypothetical protein
LRIAIASCGKGFGFHALFPFTNAPKYHRQRMMDIYGRMLLGKPDLLAQKGFRRLARQLDFRREESAPRWSRATESGFSAWVSAIPLVWPPCQPRFVEST